MATATRVGVLVGPRRLEALVKGNPGPRLAALLQAGREAGVPLFFFTLDGVDMDARTIKGITPADGGWQEARLSYPPVLYRICAVAEEQRPLFAAFLSQLRRRGTVFLNYPWFMDKWETYRCLVNTELAPHLPRTWPIADPAEVLALLEEHPQLYLKACVGGRGKQVLRVEKLGRDAYGFIRFRDGLARGKLHKFSLLREIQGFFGARPIIAQERIDLIQVNGRNVDLRAEVQRTAQGTIHVIAIAARIARRHSPITTHSVSMSLENFSRLYPSLLGDYRAFAARAEEFLCRVYAALEKCFGCCGELGIDFGLDCSGGLWFIEANSQSAKVSLFNSCPLSLIIRSYVNLLEYACAQAAQRKALD